MNKKARFKIEFDFFIPFPRIVTGIDFVLSYLFLALYASAREILLTLGVLF